MCIGEKFAEIAPIFFNITPWRSFPIEIPYVEVFTLVVLSMMMLKLLFHFTGKGILQLCTFSCSSIDGACSIVVVSFVWMSSGGKIEAQNLNGHEITLRNLCTILYIRSNLQIVYRYKWYLPCSELYREYAIPRSKRIAQNTLDNGPPPAAKATAEEEGSLLLPSNTHVHYNSYNYSHILFSFEWDRYQERYVKQCEETCLCMMLRTPMTGSTFLPSSCPARINSSILLREIRS